MFYLLDKSMGISSFKAIREFAKQNNIKKVGHTGTLDPMATGLLLIATDDDTKLIDFIDKGKKTYITEMQLKKHSETLDSDGEVHDWDVDYNKQEVISTIKSFVGTYEQMPPDFSAKKINGKRAYELARNGEEVKLKPSKVTIHSIDNIEEIGNDSYRFEVTVSRGTYVRSLIRDIANSLGTKAIMTSLRRTMVAGLKEEDSGTFIDERRLMKIPSLIIEDLDSLFNGKKMRVEAEDGKFAALYKEKVIGIIDIKNKVISNRRLFGNKYKRLKDESY